MKKSSGNTGEGNVADKMQKDGGCTGVHCEGCFKMLTNNPPTNSVIVENQ